MNVPSPISRPHAPNEHLDVLVVGAGLSGIDAAYRLQTGSPGRSYAVFEARNAIGGTWDLFRYPGIRSDSDMSTLGFPFRPWRQEKSIAEGDDIRDYIVDTARAYGIDKLIRMNHRVVAASWSSANAQWTVDVEVAGTRSRFTCNFLFMCSGYYDYAEGFTPDWPGLSDYAGRVFHPQFWPQDVDLAGKRIVVIGSGATAVTLIPALVAKGAHVTMLQRSPTYIASVPAVDAKAITLRRRLPRGLADAVIRWKNIAYSILVYRMAQRRPERLKSMIRAGQRRLLGPDFDMAEHFSPRYNPWDQRMCLVPDGDLFHALRKRQADIVTDTIKRFTADGVKLASGAELPADIIVTATGLKVAMMGGASVSVDGETVSAGTRLVYKGAMLEGVPNFAVAIGYTNASWTLKCDLTARFVSRLLNHMARRGYGAVRAIADEDAVSDEPMLGLKSGYIERAAGLLPRQGARAPWRVRQNYALDLLAFRAARLNDRVLHYDKIKPPVAAKQGAA